MFAQSRRARFEPGARPFVRPQRFSHEPVCHPGSRRTAAWSDWALNSPSGRSILFSILSLAIIVERVIALRRIRRFAESAHYPDVRAIFCGRASSSEKPFRARRAQTIARRRVRAARQSAAIARGDGAPDHASDRGACSFNLPILATAASTAPYIGLFGTVLGILSAFRQIAQSGTDRREPSSPAASPNR